MPELGIDRRNAGLPCALGTGRVDADDQRGRMGPARQRRDARTWRRELEGLVAAAAERTRGWNTGDVEYQAGDRVEYVAPPVFDPIIVTGDVGVVTSVRGDWVYAEWPHGGVHGVPAEHVRPVERGQHVGLPEGPPTG